MLLASASEPFVLLLAAAGVLAVAVGEVSVVSVVPVAVPGEALDVPVTLRDGSRAGLGWNGGGRRTGRVDHRELASGRDHCPARRDRDR
mgnify:CR=1 FL=1